MKEKVTVVPLWLSSHHRPPSGLEPNVRHHLLVHRPGHGRHHGPPQRARKGSSEEALSSVFLMEKTGANISYGHDASYVQE